MPDDPGQGLFSVAQVVDGGLDSDVIHRPTLPSWS